jgi:hypothetical protein
LVSLGGLEIKPTHSSFAFTLVCVAGLARYRLETRQARLDSISESSARAAAAIRVQSRLTRPGMPLLGRPVA